MIIDGIQTPPDNDKLLALLHRFHQEPSEQNNTRLIGELRKGKAILYVVTRRAIPMDNYQIASADLVLMQMEDGRELLALKAATSVNVEEVAANYPREGRHLTLMPASMFMEACDVLGIRFFILDPGHRTQTIIGRVGAADAPFTAMDPELANAVFATAPVTTNTSRGERLGRMKKPSA